MGILGVVGATSVVKPIGGEHVVVLSKIMVCLVLHFGSVDKWLWTKLNDHLVVAYIMVPKQFFHSGKTFFYG